MGYPTTRFEAFYRDAAGVESIVFHTDGRFDWSPSKPRAAEPLRTTIRAIAFEGRSFDSLAPLAPPEVALAAGFTLVRGFLCACELELQMPVQMMHQGALLGVILHGHLTLGPPSNDIRSHGDRLALRVSAGGQTYRSTADKGGFETQLLSLEQALPSGSHLRICFRCAHSDYSVCGQALFGTMICFREHQRTYHQVRTKDDYMEMMDSSSILVQETFVCPGFALRRPGTGYRG